MVYTAMANIFLRVSHSKLRYRWEVKGYMTPIETWYWCKAKDILELSSLVPEGGPVCDMLSPQFECFSEL